MDSIDSLHPLTRAWLPAATGEALAAFVMKERPVTTLPNLFVRRLAPHDKPTSR